jgi:hypothetical protein
MEQFIKKYDEQIIGALTGFDRLVIRGTLRSLAVTTRMLDYLSAMGVLLKDFGAYVEEQTTILKEASYEAANRLGRPIKYLESSQISKETIAREIAERDGITDGLICILKSIELCMSFQIYRDREKKKLELKPHRRKCLHLYHYWIDPIFGFMNARIQTWFPFSIQVCINGREWLARQMDSLGINYRRSDNCFTWIDNIKEAQTIMDSILRYSWPSILKDIARKLNPAHEKIFDKYTIEYYWSTYQSEVATDVMFKSPSALAEIYPALVRGALNTFSSPDVMRFLGKKMHGNFTGEIMSDFKKRSDGVRVKHRINDNSVKVYDKQGSVLRVETTINNPRDFKVYRTKEGDHEGPRTWCRMRKGVADLHRLAEISQRSNERYLDALASLNTVDTLHQMISPVCQRVIYKKRPVRALRPWSDEDSRLLHIISQGEFILNGFRNRDILTQVSPKCLACPYEKRRAMARVSRMLKVLRAHGLIRKVPRSYRYNLTLKGRKITSAILQYQNITLQQLNKCVA